MCYHVYVTMHVEDSWLSTVGVGHRVLLAGFCLSLYGLHVLKGLCYDLKKDNTRLVVVLFCRMALPPNAMQTHVDGT